MYTLKDNLRIISEGFSLPPLFVRDGELVDKQKLQEYFKNAFKVFTERLADFEKAEMVGEEKEKELRFMLEALLAAKHILTEEEF